MLLCKHLFATAVPYSASAPAPYTVSVRIDHDAAVSQGSLQQYRISATFPGAFARVFCKSAWFLSRKGLLDLIDNNLQDSSHQHTLLMYLKCTAAQIINEIYTLRIGYVRYIIYTYFLGKTIYTAVAHTTAVIYQWKNHTHHEDFCHVRSWQRS